MQPESVMRGAGGMRADIALEKNTDGRDGRRAGLGVTSQGARKAEGQSQAGQQDHRRHESYDEAWEEG